LICSPKEDEIRVFNTSLPSRIYYRSSHFSGIMHMPPRRVWPTWRLGVDNTNLEALRVLLEMIHGSLDTRGSRMFTEFIRRVSIELRWILPDGLIMGRPSLEGATGMLPDECPLTAVGMGGSWLSTPPETRAQ
jgi:hypothetical protein